MDEQRISRWLYTLKLINVAAATALFAAVWLLYYNNIITWSYQWKGNVAMALIFLVLYFLFVKVYDAFAVNLQRRTELAISQALSALFADTVMYVVICLLHEWLAPVWPMLLLFLAQTLFVSVWVLASNHWYYANTPRRRAVLLHDGGSDARHLQREMALDRSLSLTAVMDIRDAADGDLQVLDGADVVYLCAGPCRDRDTVVEACTTRKLNFFIVPGIHDMLIHAARPVHMYHMPILQMHMGRASLGYRFVKRAMDLLLSALALLLLWPLMLLLALVIRLSDGGPAFYKQVRLTKDGKEFRLIKFRSMRVDAEADGVARLSTGEQDSRITPVGKWLRRLRLDELPQLLNIFSGSMSIVGPRPERPEIAAKYEQELPEFRLRLQVKAGLTGYAQVYGKYNSSPREKLQLDMIYISRPGILEDLRLIFATVRVLFMRESTEGIEEGQTTAG